MPIFRAFLAAALLLTPGQRTLAQPAPPALETAVFAAGCFCGVEAVFEQM